MEREKRGDEMSKEQCRFCGNEATSEMDIAFQEDVQKAPVCAWHADFCRFCGNEATSEMDIAFQEDVQKAPVCAWHADFFRWMHSVLGQSVQKRIEIHNIKE